MASPVVCQGRVYVLEQGGGIIHCFDAKTGQQQYRKRLTGASGFTASPLVSGNKIYCVDQNCRTTIIEAGADLRVVATNELGEMCWASPAVAGNRIYIRTTDHLFAIGEK
jgi:outer membrane protein assembly factor BamB